MNVIYRAWMLLALVFVSGLTGAASTVEPGSHRHVFVVTGVLLNRGNKELLEIFAEELGRRADYPMDIVYADSYSALSEYLRGHPDAVGWTCGAPYVEDSVADGQQLIAVPLFKGAPLYHSVILTTARHPAARGLEDFKGMVFAYSDPRSNSGVVAPSFALSQRGIAIHEHFRVMMRTRLHENSITALLKGLADVAAVDEYVWEAFRADFPGEAARLREVERLGPFPFTPIVGGAAVRDTAVRALRTALTGMTHDNTGQRLLAGFHLDGFVVKPPSFYQPIAGMLDALFAPVWKKSAAR